MMRGVSASELPQCLACSRAALCRTPVQVKAVVLRISSPGGSAVASDMIAREVGRLSSQGVPVVACIGDVGASGGYYIAGAAAQLAAC